MATQQRDGELCPIRVPLSGLTRPGIRLLAAPKISPGCAHCYAETITLRFKRGGPFLPGKTTIKLHPDHLDAPGKWRAPKLVFVNSMSDLFHEEVPFEFISQVFDRMSDYSQHTYQVLTKRPERMMDYVRWSGNKRWPDHVWAGVSVENQHWADLRMPLLREVPCSIRFLSCEPLLKPLNLDLEGISWVIVGGRKRVPGQEDGRDVGDRHPEPVLTSGRGILFQAVGGEGRQGARKAHVGRDASANSGLISLEMIWSFPPSPRSVFELTGTVLILSSACKA
jgi:protein gp37